MMARQVECRQCAVIVSVCDGVSTTGDAHTAAVAASTAGVEAMVAALVDFALRAGGQDNITVVIIPIGAIS